MTHPAVEGRSALVVGHPGHELRVHGWLERARPVVHVLTDGSGQTGRSRLDATRRVLADAGARPGTVYGWFTDAEFYAALLERRHERVIDTVDALAGALVAEGIDCVVADAREGFSPTHDVCHLLAAAAVALAGAARGAGIARFEFALVGRPDASARAGALRIALDDAAFARKLAAARRSPDLAREVEAALVRHGADAFRTEVLRPAGPFTAPRRKPGYERYGEARVRAGRYARVIRWSDHVAPLAAAIEAHVRSACGRVEATRGRMEATRGGGNVA